MSLRDICAARLPSVEGALAYGRTLSSDLLARCPEINKKTAGIALVVFAAIVATACVMRRKPIRPMTAPKKPEVVLPNELANLCRQVREGDKAAKQALESDISMGQIKDSAHLAAAEDAIANFGKDKMGSAF